MSSQTTTPRNAGRPRRARTPIPAKTPFWRRGTTYAYGAVALFAVGVLFYAFQNGRSNVQNAGGGYSVGNPGVGASAPAITLDGTTGKVDLAAYRGKTVLLFFQEGIGCQACWDQLRDMEKDAAKFKALGVDQVVSVTTSPLDLVRQKAADEHLVTPIASDPNLAVSTSYHTNQFGMMGDSRDGHSFVLIAPDGKIRWRADYGGAPKYTMYVPDSKLLADLAQGTGQTAGKA